MGRPLHWLLFVLVTVFLSCLQAGVLISGALGVRFDRPLAALVVVVAAVVAALFARMCPAPEAGDDPPSSWQVRVLAAASVSWAISLWARLWWLASRREPYDWDGLYYHLPAIHQWVGAGRVHWIETVPDVPFVNYPMGVEATTFALWSWHRDSGLVDAANLWYWPLAVLAVVAAARRLGAGSAWSWFAGGLVGSAPVLVCQSLTLYIDPGFAATVMAVLALSMVVACGRGRAVTSWWLLWGAALGLMIGAKGSGLPFAAAAAAAVGAVRFRRADDDTRLLATGLALAAAAALAVGGYWYLRAALETGNPVHPIRVAFGAKELWPGYDHRVFSEANLPAWLADYPAALRPVVSWLQLDAPIRGYAPTGGLGYVWLAAGLPAVAVMAALGWRRRAVAPLFLTALALVFFGAQTSAWWGRFVVWLIGLGLPALALVLRCWEGPQAGLRRWTAVAAGVACLALGIRESEGTFALEAATQLAPGSTAEEAVYQSSFAALFGPESGTPGVDRFLAAEVVARGPWGRLGTLMGGALSLPLDARRLIALPAEPDRESVAALAPAGVQWVLWDREAAPVPSSVREAAREEIEFRPGPGADFVLLRLQ